MSAIPFDTPKLAPTATKDDIALMQHHLVLMEQRLTIKLGGMFVVAVGVLTALLKLIP
ncbi:MAG TPA: hypothetical protein VLA00_03365 [Xanthobacteraceae bacterium]|nr:hypothetical protein [Xanthobacteraceae bacterium]